MVTFSESFASFLYAEADKGSRVAQLICNARHNTSFRMYQRILTNSEIDYITMRPDGLVSYLPHGKEHRTNERGEWAREGRQSGKAGKVIRKVFNEKILRFIEAKHFESFGNAYKAKFMDNGFKFELKDRACVKEVYNMRRAEGEASLNSSCMNGDAIYLNMYEQCKDLRILVLTNKVGHLCGRALVWNVKHKEQTITFMDRIYVAEDYMYDLFTNYAREQAWWRKSNYKSMESKCRWVNPETDETEEVAVEIRLNTDHDRYPYIDTFAYGGEGYISNNCMGDYTYNNIDGSRDGDDRYEEEEDDHENETWDEINEEYISDDDAVQISNEYGNRRWRGRYTHQDNCVNAKVGYRDWHWFHEDDDSVVKIGSDWYHTDYEDVVYRADEEYDLSENCVQCETDGEYYESGDSDMIRSEDGNYYHKENDDNVIYVQALDNEDGGDYFYHPDIEGEVVKEVTTDKWYYVEDKRIKRVELHTGAHCQQVWAKKIDLLKWRNKIYHKDDSRIENKTTRKAYPTL